MTTLLQKAFAEAAKLPQDHQDLIASWLLAELNGEDEFGRRIERSADRLVPLAHEAIAEHRCGQTEVLDPEKL